MIDVAHGVIQGVQTGESPSSATATLDGVILPGLVSAHSHAFHRALRGRTHGAGGDFWAWRGPMYELANRLDPPSYRRLVGEVFAEMLRAGITGVGEFHYLHHQPDGQPYDAAHAMELAVVGAAIDTGMRLTLLDTCYLAADVKGAPPQHGQRRFSDGTVQAWAERVKALASTVNGANIRIGVAAHSVRSVPAADLPIVASTGLELEAPVHVHVSEQRAENEACFAHHGISPTRLLADTGLLTPATTAVHATHLAAGDIELYAGTRSSACFCPTTERDLGDGVGLAIEMADHGIDLCLGSDSNATVDLFREAQALEMNDRLRLERRGIHSPDELLRAATVSGLAAIGWGRHEPLAPGSPADFLCVDLDAADLAGATPDAGIGPIVFSADRHAVTDVIVAGVHVVADRLNASEHSAAGLHSAIQAVVA